MNKIILPALKTMAQRLLFAAIMLSCYGLANAYSTHYQDKSCPIFTDHKDGTFTIKFLVYDAAPTGHYDNFLNKLEVYVAVDGAMCKVYEHRGGYRKWKATPAYWGSDSVFNQAELVGSVGTETSKDSDKSTRYWKTVKIKAPTCIWGKYWLHFEGDFQYKYLSDKDNTNFNFNSAEGNMGAPRWKQTAQVNNVSIEPNSKTIRVNISKIKMPTGAGGGFASYVVLKKGTQSLTLQALIGDGNSNYDLPIDGGFDFTEDTSIEPVIKTTYGKLTNEQSLGQQKVKALSKPVDLSATYYTLSRTVSLSWTPSNVDISNGCDKYAVYRRTNTSSTWRHIVTGNAAANSSKVTVTDYTVTDVSNPLQNNTKYTYKVVYYRSKWNLSDSQILELATNDDIQITTTPSLKPTLTAGRDDGNQITLNWNIPYHTEFANKNCQVKIYRTGNNNPIYTGNFATTGSFIDTGADITAQGKEFSGEYEYILRLDATNSWYACVFSSDKVKGQTLNAAHITSIKASQGEFAGQVRLEWNVKNYVAPGATVPDNTEYTIYRRVASRTAGEAESNFDVVHTLSSNANLILWKDNDVLPGIYYEYKILGQAKATNTERTIVETEAKAQGFCRSNGVITGSITFGTGTAVAGVQVLAKPNVTVNDITSSRCLHFQSNNATAAWNYSDEKADEYFGNDFSLQMWVHPKKMPATLSLPVGHEEYATLVNINDRCRFILVQNDNGTFTLGYINKAADGTTSGGDILDGIPSDQYSHLNIVKNSSSIVVTAFYNDDNEMKKITATAPNSVLCYNSGDPTHIKLGAGFNGWLDEFRIWKKALTEQEITDNYDTSISGNDDKLTAYWRFDEGLKNAFYDSSHYGTIYNSNNGTIDNGVETSTNVPDFELLGLKGKTDTEGNYIIEGVPFGGEGTSYSIIPNLGVHKFSPQRSLRYVGPSSLIHNGTDFTDVSSFTVKGVVYYENTTYPVEGCNLYVDGQVCARNGEMVATDDEGRFTIDVPIGQHYITVKKNGHTFVNDGRYPETQNPEVITTVDFDREITGLTFFDNTQSHLTGRVTGGDTEGDKPIGFKMSKNTIGKAQLVLRAQDDKGYLNAKKVVNGTVVSYESNDEELPVNAVAEATGVINSKSWRGKDALSRRIFIETDPETGEFSALLPPLMYILESAKVIATGQSLLANGEEQTLDLTNVEVEKLDSIPDSADSTKIDLFKYHCKLPLTHHVTPTFTVTDESCNDGDRGAFGINSAVVNDFWGATTVNDIYTIDDATGKVTYNYGTNKDKTGGVPIFLSEEKYRFKIHGYEEYVNYDDPVGGPVKFTVPLAGSIVTVFNDLSDEQAVVVSDESGEHKPGDVFESTSYYFELDSIGTHIYEWVAGLPNVTAPYTRTISINYSVGNRDYTWDGSGMEAIIFGSLTTGSNFVTAGPDVVHMILRDPPGSRSSAQWTSGTAHISHRFDAGTWNNDNNFTWVEKCGVDVATIQGNICLATVGHLDSTKDLSQGLSISEKGYAGKNKDITYSITDAISTSDSPSYVGSNADIYIGSGTNIVFGEARNVGFVRESSNEIPKIKLTDAMQTSAHFVTAFYYTQDYIVNTLIPNLKDMLKQVLVTRPQSEIDNFQNVNDEPVYLTPHDPSSEKWGKKNYSKDEFKDRVKKNLPINEGPNYWMFVNDPSKNYSDTVNWIIEQIEGWERVLSLNEEDKVKSAKEAEKKAELKNNMSFNGGMKITHTEQNDTVEGTKWSNSISAAGSFGRKTGFSVNKTGVLFEMNISIGGGHTVDAYEYDKNTCTFAYTLMEDAGDDALSVDVIKSQNKFAPIFSTRAGQTSSPYEGEERTKWYEPGKHILNTATMKMESPRITADVPVMNDIPSGRPANFTIHMANEADVSNSRSFILTMLDKSNPNGAILRMDGAEITDGRKVKVPADGRLTKSLQLIQSDPSILTYNNIGLVLSSANKYDSTGADTLYISARFVPSSSPVELKIERPVVNVVTGNSLNMQLCEFDRNYHNLRRFRLQYKPVGNAAWINFHEYVLHEEQKTENNEYFPSEGAVVNYTLDMSTMHDGEYLFRAVSYSAYGDEEVSYASDEVKVVKDTKRPVLISNPSPTDGILNPGDEIAVIFNEDIRNDYLNLADNFIVCGQLNDAEVSHDGVFFSAAGQGARTQAAINLANRSFTFANWLKWSKSGSIIHHGTESNNFDIRINDNGKLVVKIGNETVTSESSIPADTWCYLCVAFDNSGDTPKVTADVHYDAFDITLIDHKPMPKYEGNGAVTVGQGITAAIHEVTLWDSAIKYVELKDGINNVKPAATAGLMGYWRLDEGHGNRGDDKARFRHLTLPDGDNWTFASTNHALQLTDESAAHFNLTKANTTDDQNYMIEFWLKAEKQKEDATIFALGNDTLALKTANDGMKLMIGQQTTAVNRDVFDNSWHHIALNVLKGTLGMATLYIDGNSIAQVPASQLPNIQTDRLTLGATYDIADDAYTNHFTGNFDELRIWIGTRSAAMIREQMHRRVDANTPALAAYYPFESMSLDAYNQIITEPSLADMSETKALDAAVYRKAADATYQPVEQWHTTAAPGLATAPKKENVNFSYTASERKILINLEADEKRIEGCTLEFTVKNVQDAVGNESAPVTWTAYVKQNQLEWSQSSVDLVLEDASSTSFDVDIINSGGTSIDWSLTDLPIWLTTDNEAGTILPLSSRTLRFNITPGTAIGQYEAVIGLRGTNDISTNLVVTLNVIGKRPQWSVNAGDFEHIMNMVGVLKINNTISEDANDIVAAFINGECRGVASPQYLPRYDAYFVMLNIYGNDDDIASVQHPAAEITYKVFDASTGIIYPVVDISNNVRFAADELVGNPINPVQWTTRNQREQSNLLKKGWNWMSLYVAPQDMSIDAVMKSACNKVELMKAKKEQSYFSGEWMGELQNIELGKMYKVKMTDDAQFNIVGDYVQPHATPITVASGWNWLGYVGSDYISINDAFAGLNPANGDLVKSRNAFAMYMDYEWVGTLQKLEPGFGYVYQSTDVATKTFTYPEITSQRSVMAIEPDMATAHKFTPCDEHKYQGNMTMVAQVVCGGEPIDCEVGIFDSQDECRASSLTMGSDKLTFLTIQGEGSGEPLHIKVAYQSGDEELVAEIETSLAFSNDMTVGTPADPYIINLDKSGIANVSINYNDGQYYDLLGRRIENPLPGIYIRNGQLVVVK